ncbi:MAG: hypothetical protein HYY06_08595 [Deltaproteobacteria bacterium]|nr:hypothetical protein [Deltaproteobacteria bacterium]
MSARTAGWAPPRALTKTLTGIAVAGAVTLVAGLFVSPHRAWGNLLLAGYAVLGLALGGVFFVALQHVTKAGWSTALRRVPEAMSAALPIAAALLALVAIGGSHIYEWTHHETVAGDAILRAKQGWLDLPFFVGRAAVCFGLWLLFAWRLSANSRAQDGDGDPGRTASNVRLSAVFLLLFAPTFSVATFDWVMSLEPHWFSTIFAVYSFAGLFTSSLAAITVVCIVLRRLGALHGIVTEEHLHDLGKLLFGFCTFWAYIWFSQYMLIWYSNIPEETAYFVGRTSGGWLPLSIVNVVANWALPFLLLLPRAAKRNEKMLLRVSFLVLAGHWLDLYLMIMKPILGEAPALGPLEVLPLAGAIALGALVFFRALGRANLVPAGDPTLGESLHHHT